MSLYEVVSMNLAMKTLEKTHKPQVSQEQWDKGMELLKSVTANDPKVRLH